jgi:hypothetical protein
MLASLIPSSLGLEEIMYILQKESKSGGRRGGQLSLLLLGVVAGTLTLLSAGCTTSEGHGSNVSLVMPETAAPPQVQSDGDSDFYQPPRNPQFNTARDQ